APLPPPARDREALRDTRPTLRRAAHPRRRGGHARGGVRAPRHTVRRARSALRGRARGPPRGLRPARPGVRGYAPSLRGVRGRPARPAARGPHLARRTEPPLASAGSPPRRRLGSLRADGRPARGPTRAGARVARVARAPAVLRPRAHAGPPPRSDAAPGA